WFPLGRRDVGGTGSVVPSSLLVVVVRLNGPAAQRTHRNRYPFWWRFVPKLTTPSEHTGRHPRASDHLKPFALVLPLLRKHAPEPPGGRGYWPRRIGRTSPQLTGRGV